MSTSLLHHALNIFGYHHRTTEYLGRESIFILQEQAVGQKTMKGTFNALPGAYTTPRGART